MTELKAPASQQEWDEMKKLLRREISDSDLESVVGGNDDVKPRPDPVPWVCPFCGATIMVRQFQDGPKHMTKCPNNPYK